MQQISPDVRRPSLLSRLLMPSLSDVMFIVLMSILFLSGQGWYQLLADGESGTHIRTGDYILASRSIPVSDLYYFHRPEAPWFAWEWLADVVFAVTHSAMGLKGVVLLSGALIGLALTLLFRRMIAGGVEVHIAAALTILAADAVRFHFLARPLVFTSVLATAAFWLLAADWSRPRRALWVLAPVAVIWANLHGGFLVLLVATGLYTVGAVIAKDWQRIRRYGFLSALCAAGTLANPYGWHLHAHILRNLRADWVVKYVEEFQPPVFRGEGMIKAEILLFLGLMSTVYLFRRRRYPEALLVLFWAHAALTSGRHLTVFALAAVPAIGEFLSAAWQRWTTDRSAKSTLGIFRDLAIQMHPSAARTSCWAVVLILALALSKGSSAWPTDFPDTFPTALVSRNMNRLARPGSETSGILSADIWGGYLAYRFYPNRRIFVDGRSDYFGQKVLEEYVMLRAAKSGWEDVFSRYHFRFALIPPDWALTGELTKSNEWVLVDQDKTAMLFERRDSAPQSLASMNSAR